MYPKRTLQLVEDSLDAWRKKAEATKPGDVDTGHEACPLCCEFWRIGRLCGGRLCGGCPIRAFTGKSHCYGTPIYRVDEALSWWKASESERRRQHFVLACEKEIRFLEEIKQHAIMHLDERDETEVG